MPTAAPARSWRRKVWAAVLVAFFLGGLGRLVDFPPGYIGAQSLPADELAARTDWAALRRGTTGDLFVFTPGYALAGAALIWAVVGLRRHRTIAWVLLAVGVLADWLETTLFRRSLTRLLGGSSAADIETLANVTRVASAVKYLALIGALGYLVWAVIDEQRHPQRDG